MRWPPRSKQEFVNERIIAKTRFEMLIPFGMFWQSQGWIELVSTTESIEHDKRIEFEAAK
jgi:hypothetical protein